MRYCIDPELVEAGAIHFGHDPSRSPIDNWLNHLYTEFDLRKPCHSRKLIEQ